MSSRLTESRTRKMSRQQEKRLLPSSPASAVSQHHTPSRIMHTAGALLMGFSTVAPKMKRHMPVSTLTVTSTRSAQALLLPAWAHRRSAMLGDAPACDGARGQAGRGRLVREPGWCGPARGCGWAATAGASLGGAPPTRRAAPPPGACAPARPRACAACLPWGLP
jgi:hypothetical protein